MVCDLQVATMEEDGQESLNPCCSGRWSATIDSEKFEPSESYDVLILVVVEDGLRHFVISCTTNHHRRVLILVVVEDGLRRRSGQSPVRLGACVLILVVVEDGLRLII